MGEGNLDKTGKTNKQTNNNKKNLGWMNKYKGTCSMISYTYAYV